MNRVAGTENHLRVGWERFPPTACPSCVYYSLRIEKGTRKYPQYPQYPQQQEFKNF
jgi:hypothetical protein